MSKEDDEKKIAEALKREAEEEKKRAYTDKEALDEILRRANKKKGK